MEGGTPVTYALITMSVAFPNIAMHTAAPYLNTAPTTAACSSRSLQCVFLGTPPPHQPALRGRNTHQLRAPQILPAQGASHEALREDTKTCLPSPPAPPQKKGGDENGVGRSRTCWHSSTQALWGLRPQPSDRTPLLVTWQTIDTANMPVGSCQAPCGTGNAPLGNNTLQPTGHPWEVCLSSASTLVGTEREQEQRREHFVKPTGSRCPRYPSSSCFDRAPTPSATQHPGPDLVDDGDEENAAHHIIGQRLLHPDAPMQLRVRLPLCVDEGVVGEAATRGGDGQCATDEGTATHNDDPVWHNADDCLFSPHDYGKKKDVLLLLPAAQSNHRTRTRARVRVHMRVRVRVRAHWSVAKQWSAIEVEYEGR